MKKCLLSAAMLMAGMGAWAQEMTEEEKNALMEEASPIAMSYSMGIETQLGWPVPESDVAESLCSSWMETYQNPTTENYEALKTALANFYSEKVQIAKPKAGKAYIITAWWNTTYESDGNFPKKEWPLAWNSTKGYYEPTAGAEGDVFVCDVIDGQYIFVSNNGNYLGWEADGKSGFTGKTYVEGQKFTLEKADLERTRGDINDGLVINDLLGKFCLKSDDGDYLMYNSSNSKYANDQPGSKYYGNEAHTVFFTITEATYTANYFTIKNTSTLADSELCVATFYSPNYATKMPEGYKAYWAESVDGEEVTLELLEDIPANTAVVVTGAGSDNPIVVSLSTANPDAVTGNKLFGYAENTTVDKTNVYTLANGTNGVAFYPYDAEQFAAGKAYLDGPAADVAGARSLIFNFGGDTETAIESIEGAESAADAVVYDLAGRRVQGAQKGLYIVNGKVVIK